MQIDRNLSEIQDHYNIHIEGHNLVDGISFHPIGITNTENAEGFYDIYYERQDGVRIPFYDEIKGGQMGAIIDLRGSKLDEVNGLPNDGTLQDIIDQLDAFANGLIESTNNIYAQSASQSMQAQLSDIPADYPLLNTGYNVREGSFDVEIYDIDGNPVATRTITISATTVMDDGVYAADGSVITPPTTNSIVGQFQEQLDDNGDNNATNDVDDLLNVFFSSGGELSISVDDPSTGMTFAIKDNTTNGLADGSNFAGAIGLQRFFDGRDGYDFKVTDAFRNVPSTIRAFNEPVDGNSDVALDMVQLQYDDVTFVDRGGMEEEDTLYGYYDSLATYVGSKTNASIISNDAITAQYNAVEMEYFSISKVSIDEEMTNLIKYQTAYGASAKVITTIDQMINTLLGIKQ
jgi:flagellar hook-associated protein 1 FlgK